METALQCSSHAEQSYCAPWDLKAQTERFHGLKNQRSRSPLSKNASNRNVLQANPSSSSNSTAMHSMGIRSARMFRPCSNRNLLHWSTERSRSLSIQPSQSAKDHDTSSAIDLSLINNDAEPLSFQVIYTNFYFYRIIDLFLMFFFLKTALLYFHHLTAGSSDIQSAYEQPWDSFKATLLEQFTKVKQNENQHHKSLNINDAMMKKTLTIEQYL